MRDRTCTPPYLYIWKPWISLLSWFTLPKFTKDYGPGMNWCKSVTYSICKARTSWFSLVSYYFQTLTFCCVYEHNSFVWLGLIQLGLLLLVYSVLTSYYVWRYSTSFFVWWLWLEINVSLHFFQTLWMDYDLDQAEQNTSFCVCYLRTTLHGELKQVVKFPFLKTLETSFL